eukprot:10765372-Alexandrium_andersonii.AAC.1
MAFQDGDGGGAARAHPAAREQAAKDLGQTFRAPRFWAYCHMLVAVETVLKKLETFLACPCHPARREAMLRNLEGRTVPEH